MEEGIIFGMSKLNYGDMNDNQRAVVTGYLNGSDVLYCSPTGSGKALVFEISPFAFSYYYHRDALPALTSSVIVISPLVSLMRAQVKKMQSLGLKAAYLTDETDKKDSAEVSMKEIKRGHFDILVCSPESILGDHRGLVKDLSERKILRAIFVDQAHCIVKLGKPCPVTNRAALRPAYGQLGELRSLTGPDVPVIALTDTASLETIQIIKKDLCFQDCLDVVVSPNKLNIKYTVLDVKMEDTRANFKWLIHLLEKYGVNTPRLIIFFRKVDHMSVAYKHIVNTLGPKVYINSNNNEANDYRNRIIDMFHMKTTNVVKSSICQSFEDPAGHIRVLLCSTAFPMGLDLKGVDTVVHYGPANNIEDYIQETGTAGRNPNENCHAILMKHKRSLSSKNISQEIKAYVNELACRRSKLLSTFSNDTEYLKPVPAHLCCDNCTKLCKCACKCKNNMCNCDVTCDVKSNLVMQYMQDRFHSDLSSSDSSDTDESDIGFDSESNFEEYLSKQPKVVSFSDESD